MQAGKQYRLAVVVSGSVATAFQLTEPLDLVVRSPSGIHMRQQLDMHGFIAIRALQLEEWGETKCPPEGGPVQLAITRTPTVGQWHRTQKPGYPRDEATVYLRIKNEGGAGETSLGVSTKDDSESKRSCFEKGREYDVRIELYSTDWRRISTLPFPATLPPEIELRIRSEAGLDSQQTLALFYPGRELVWGQDIRVDSISIMPVTEGQKFPPDGEVGKWGVTQQDDDLQIAFGRASDYPQYASLDLKSGYLRMIYGPEAGWGTSVLLLPSFWSGGTLHQSGQVSANWETIHSTLVVTLHGSVSGLLTHVQVTFYPPLDDTLLAYVSAKMAALYPAPSSSSADIRIDTSSPKPILLAMMSPRYLK